MRERLPVNSPAPLSCSPPWWARASWANGWPAANVAIAPLANALATGAAPVALIVTFGPISGAHFNPLVTLATFERERDTIGTVAAFIAAQIAGAIAGVVLAHAMFDLSLIQTATHAKTGFGQFLSEVLATAGLIAVALSCTTSKQAAWRIPAWIGAAYWFTASTSFANPAITVARALSDTFAGIRPEDVPAFIAAQSLGAIVGLGIARWLISVETHGCAEATTAQE